MNSDEKPARKTTKTAKKSESSAPASKQKSEKKKEMPPAAGETSAARGAAAPLARQKAKPAGEVKLAPPAPEPAPLKSTKPTAAKKSAAKKPAPQASAGEQKSPALTRAAKPPAPEPVVALEVISPKKAAKTEPAAAPVREEPPSSPKTTKGSGRPKKPLTIPPVLLEPEEEPSLETPKGPGQRYALGPTPAKGAAPISKGELPESYGTEKLLIAARDPHWIFAAWDISRAKLRQYNSASRDGHLVIRMHQGNREGEVVSETHVNPESKTWFVHVGRGETSYVAELGYFDVKGNWTTVAVSKPAFTPPEQLSDDRTVQFATIPSKMTFQELIAAVAETIREHQPLVRALEELRERGESSLPEIPAAPAREWTPAQEAALAKAIRLDAERRVWVGSLEVTELVRRQIEQGISSLEQVERQRAAAAKGQVSSLFSPFGAEEKTGKFWFNINAELIVYGATEPDATVTIGGRPIKLRTDGSFSYRFALPDGDYALPAHAMSADGLEIRKAILQFIRQTEYEGEVRAHPRDEKLKTPRPENVE